MGWSTVHVVVHIRDLEEQILQFNFFFFVLNEKTAFFLDLKSVGAISELVGKRNVLVP